jgi:hypothetical protein
LSVAGSTHQRGRVTSMAGEGLYPPSPAAFDFDFDFRQRI